MKIRNPIEPLAVVSSLRWMRVTILVLAAMLLTCVPWAYMIQQERETSDRLLAEALTRQPKVVKLTMNYNTGAKQQVLIREAP